VPSLLLFFCKFSKSIFNAPAISYGPFGLFFSAPDSRISAERSLYVSVSVLLADDSKGEVVNRGFLPLFLFLLVDSFFRLLVHLYSLKDPSPTLV